MLDGGIGGDAGDGASAKAHQHEDGHIIHQLRGVDDEDGHEHLTDVMHHCAEHADDEDVELELFEQDHGDHAQHAAGHGIQHGGHAAEHKAGEHDLDDHQHKGGGGVKHIECEHQHAVAQTQLDAGNARGHGDHTFDKAQHQHHGGEQTAQRGALDVEAIVSAHGNLPMKNHFFHIINSFYCFFR